jgi:hypothetical protein
MKKNISWKKYLLILTIPVLLLIFDSNYIANYHSSAEDFGLIGPIFLKYGLILVIVATIIVGIYNLLKTVIVVKKI